MSLKRLPENGVIGIFSPAAPGSVTAPKRFERAVQYLEDKGFRIVPGMLSGKGNSYRSGGIRERAHELNTLLSDPKIDCIMSVIGGLNSNAIIPYIDYEAFQNRPKILIGFSDTTAVLLAVYARTGIHTFFGPALIPSFGEFTPFVDETYRFFSDILIKKNPYPHSYPMPTHHTDEMINWEEWSRDKQKTENAWITVNGGKAGGRLLGGTLNAITGIWGTPYMPAIETGDILFIEDTSKNPPLLERLFSTLKLAGVFDRISGLILGKHERFDDMGTDIKPWEILLEVMDGIDIPCMAQFDCGHTHPMHTLPLGAMVELDADNRTVSLLEPIFEND